MRIAGLNTNSELMNALASPIIYNTIGKLPLTFIANHQGGIKGTSAMPVIATSVTK